MDINKTGSIMKKYLEKLKKKICVFLKDNFGGNLIEYALLIGFALFMFFLIVGIVTSILDWTLGLSNDFFNLFG
jgi:Flp pilus assembly pilin Flp